VELIILCQPRTATGRDTAWRARSVAAPGWSGTSSAPASSFLILTRCVGSTLKAGGDGDSDRGIKHCRITHADQDMSRPVKVRFETLLMSGQYVKLVQLTPFIATDARDLRWNHGVNLCGADAIHVASALDRKCEEFITTDRQAKKMAAKATLEQLGQKSPFPASTYGSPSYRQCKRV